MLLCGEAMAKVENLDEELDKFSRIWERDSSSFLG